MASYSVWPRGSVAATLRHCGCVAATELRPRGSVAAALAPNLQGNTQREQSDEGNIILAICDKAETHRKPALRRPVMPFFRMPLKEKLRMQTFRFRWQAQKENRFRRNMKV